MFIGSAIAAISGVLFVINLGFASANDYVMILTLDVWVMVVLGGIGNNWGALLGALIVTILDRVTAIAAIQLDVIDINLEFTFVRFILFRALRTSENPRLAEIEVGALGDNIILGSERRGGGAFIAPLVAQSIEELRRALHDG